MKYEYNHTVGAYDINSKMQLSIPAMVKIFYEASLQHTIQLKVSYWDLIPLKLSWVLVRKRLDIIKQPCLGDDIKVITYPTGVEKFYTFRDFKMYDQAGELLATISTTWLLMDVEARKIARIPNFIQDLQCPEPPYLEREKGKIPKLKTPEFTSSMQVSWADLDWNEHLNNIYYLREMLNTLPLEIHKERQLRSLSIVFKNEARYGASLFSETQQDTIEQNHLQFIHQIRNSDTNKILATGQTIWE